MKTNFDKKNPKKFLGYLMASALVFFAGSVTAQTNHDVIIDSQTNTFTPASLTIDVGDQVTFTNDGGFHNVNGDLSTYPNNADGSLYSGAASNSLTTYVWVCTTAGNYDYQCDPHVSVGMVGTIAANAPPTACALDEVTLTMNDSYGDGWGCWQGGANSFVTIDGVDYSNASSFSETATLCVDLSTCIDVIFTAGACDVSEVSWEITDASGAVIASGDDNSADFGNCAVSGCTDMTACNYDAVAVVDDGSCTFAATGYDCNGDCLSGDAVVYNATGTYSYENSWSITDCDGAVIASGDDNTAAACVTLPAVYTVTLSDSWGDGWNGNSLTVGTTTYTQSYTSSGSPNDESFNVGACPVLGCMDATATNFNSAADTDDGSCVYDPIGCTDMTACNYDAVAVVDDGSCTFAATGFDCAGACLSGDAVTLSLYDQYNDGWGYTDGSQSILTVDGVDYTITAGTESFILCLDLTACTDVIFTPANGWDTENSWDIVDASGAIIASGGNNSGNVGACAVYGCTDPAANNYDAAANTDDGSCVICSGNWVNISCGMMAGYPTEISWTLFASDGSVTLSGNAGDYSSSYSLDTCLPNDCYTLEMVDSYGDGWNGNTFVMSMGGVAITTLSQTGAYSWPYTSGATETADIALGTACPVYGCTDATAMNFDANADTDDGSCIYSIPGCMDASTWTFDATATVDDGSCCYGDELTLTLDDSYGDGWNGGILTIGGVDYTMLTGSTISFGGICDLGCDSAIYTAGNWSTENSWTITDANGTVVGSGANNSSQYGSTCPVYGCMDVTALNFDSTATIDDGSCAYICDVYTASAVVDAAPSCNGADDASATAILDASFGDDYYLWSDGQTSSTATGLAAGTYTCTITDSVNGCSTIATVVIDDAAVIDITGVPFDATPGSSNGGVEVTVTGGTACYTGAASSLASGVSSLGYTYSSIFNLTPTTNLGVTSIDAMAMGGAGGMVEIWTSNGNASGQTADASNWTLAGSAVVPANNYEALVNVPVTGISGDLGDTIGVWVYINSAILIDASQVGNLTALGDLEASDANLGISTGNISSGTPGAIISSSAYAFLGNINYNLGDYTYAWSNGETTEDISGLSLGPISLTVTDCNGCTASWSGFILTNYVYGCIDTLASNYDPAANTMDTIPSCLYDGCTDPDATNYDATANNDDGSCEYDCAYYGYSDELTIEFQADWYAGEASWVITDAFTGDTVLASPAYSGSGGFYTSTQCIDDGCYFLTGADTWGDGWTINVAGYLEVSDLSGNSLALIDGADLTGPLNSNPSVTVGFTVGSASCAAGCTDPAFTNFDINAILDDGSCSDSIVGCTDLTASNYTPFSNYDDGSCCYSDVVTLNLYDSWGDGWDWLGVYNSVTINGDTFTSDLASESFELCVDLSVCTDVTYNALANYTNENSWDITDASGAIIASGGPASGTFGLCPIYGCMDSTAINFDPAVTNDDGSCVIAACATSVNVTSCYSNQDLLTWTFVADVPGTPITVFFNSGFIEMDAAWDWDAIYMYDGTAGNNMIATTNNNNYYGWAAGYYAGDMAGVSVTANSDTLTIVLQADAYADCAGAATDWTLDFDVYCASQAVLGCTDAAATNYDATATVDDGSCLYPCLDNTVMINMYDSFGDGWNGNTYTISDASGNVVATDGLTGGYANYDSLCLPTGCYSIEVGGGSYQNEVSFTFGSIVDAAVGTYIESVGGASCIAGCTDAAAQNYDATANIDDGSCSYCTDNIVPVSTDFFSIGTGYDWANWGVDFSVNEYNGSVVDSGNSSTNLCLPDGCYEFVVIDNSGVGNGSYSVYDVNGTVGAGVGAMMFEVGPAGSCPVFGCTDPTALNFDATATADDGSCTYPCLLDEVTLVLTDSYGDGWNGNSMTINGVDYTQSYTSSGSPLDESFVICMDLTGCDSVIYNATGTWSTENSWSVLDASGAILASGPNASGTVGNGCPVFGCTDPTAANYDSAADTDDGSCDYLGCINPTATNYDPTATIDDGSCVFGCQLDEVTLVLTDSYGDGWNGNSLEFNGVTYTQSYTGFGNPNDESFTNICVDLTGCIDVTYNATGTYGYENSWSIVDASGAVIASGGDASGNVGSGCPVYGCTDPAATNYDATANTDDGTCSYLGCTDPAATNYNANATTDDGSCVFPCTLDEVTLTMNDSYGDGWGCWQGGANSFVTIDGVDYSNASSFSETATLCVDLSTCIDVIFTAGACDASEVSWEITDASGAVIASGDDNSADFGNCAVLGCTDMNANNYDATATVDDGNCTYDVLGCTDMNANNYDATATVDDGNCTYDVLGCTDPLACNYDILANTDDGSCNTAYGCMDATQYNYDATATCDDNSCIPFTYGCTDASASNYNATVNTDDASCIWLGCTDATANNYDATATVDDGTCNYDVSGCTDMTANNYDATATVDDGTCTYDVLGCTDMTANNYDANATTDDGSCTYPPVTCTKPVPTGIYIDEIIQVQAKIHWDNMTDANCMALKYYIQVREVGTSTWTNKLAQDAGLCNFGLPTTSKMLNGLTPSTTYEYRMKAAYCSTTGTSLWTSMSTFTTADECPNVTNFTATPGPQPEKVVFSWDTVSAYSMVRIKLRVDSISNPQGSDWQVAGGFGVNYPALSVNKWGLTPGEYYRGQARTWCNPAGGLYRSANWTSLVWWTQPASVRLEGGAAINNLDVYPNPSRDIFNVTFTSEDVQDLEVRVINIVGEVIYAESLEQFVGEYTKAIDLATYTKGVYFLEITTNTGVVNKKLILQ